MRYASAFCGLLVACTTPAERAERAQMLAHCQSIVVFPSPIRPDRPFRMLGSVQVQTERASSSTYRQLREQACSLGADAVMDVKEMSFGVADNIVAVPGSYGSNPQATYTGMAVRYTDTVTPPPAPPADPAAPAHN